MQELLGRIARLDPSASLGLRVIACFDELVVGNVNTRALLAAAASLAGCVVGFEQAAPYRAMRVDPRGELADRQDGEGAPRTTAAASDGLLVWLERSGEPHANDAIILERLALSVRIRHGRGGGPSDSRRDLDVLVADTGTASERGVAAAALGLESGASYRVVAAPLFAVWTHHPQGPEDVVPTRLGPVHALVLPAATLRVDASPCGIGVATDIGRLDHSFRTALVSLQLCDPPTTPVVTADEYGGLIGLLADAPTDTHQPDALRLDAIARHAWGAVTIDALIRTSSIRQAALLIGVHHSTMQSRVDAIVDQLGFNPYDGFGRTRLGTAYLVWRLRTSRVLQLPAPQPSQGHRAG